jgi:hypothetical protein
MKCRQQRTVSPRSLLGSEHRIQPFCRNTVSLFGADNGAAQQRSPTFIGRAELPLRPTFNCALRR